MSSQIVKEKIAHIRKSMPRVNLADTRIMAHNLVFIYQVIKASEALLIAAMDECLKSSEYDQEMGYLYSYFAEHLREETGHAEWLRQDLESAGWDVSKIQPMKKASEMAGMMFYNIKFYGPKSLLGYMAVLEGEPMSLQMVEQLETVHGKAMMRTVRYHSEHDIEHSADLFKVIDNVYDEIVLTSAVWAALNIVDFSNYLCETYK